MIAKRRKDDLEYLKLCYAVDRVIEAYGNTPVEKWRHHDEIVAFLRPLKRMVIRQCRLQGNVWRNDIMSVKIVHKGL